MFFYILLVSLSYYLYKKYLMLNNLIKRCYFYNQSWDDSCSNIRTYKIRDNNNILMTTSGGDNVLNYLLENPDHIDAVDENIYQNYLLQTLYKLKNVVFHLTIIY